MRYEIALDGPFELDNASQYFGGWLPFSPDPSAVAMPFPVEGWDGSAVVVIRQPGSGIITGEVYGVSREAGTAQAEAAWRQALAVLSLDSDAKGWPQVGERDPVIGRLQHAYSFLRPVLFHSPYEAACAFMIGHRISIAQGRAIRQAMSQELGERINIPQDGQGRDMSLYAFPRPQALSELDAFKGVSAEKIERLHGVARAALDGLLDRAYLRSTPTDEALEKLRALRGVGKFFAQGILMRGAGVVDDVPDDDVTAEAVQLAYELPGRPSREAILETADNWRPYRMWATVLLHVWLRREAGGPHRR